MSDGLGLTELAQPIGLGTNTFGRTTDAAASHAVLDEFVAQGGRLVDTADTYAAGVSEEILGTWLGRRGGRHDVILASKCGNHPDHEGLGARTVMSAAEASLRRLGTDYIDLYFAHYQDDDTAIEESAGAFDALVRAGKIRAVGLSNFTADAVQAWLDAAHRNDFAAPVALQPHYSLVHRVPYEAQLAPVAAEAGLAVMPYRALGGGFLSGKYRRESDTHDTARGPGVRPLLTGPGLSLLHDIDIISTAHQVAPAAIALAWLLSRPTVTAPLVSATSPRQLGELLTASRVVLTGEELRRLDHASRQVPRVY